MIVKIRESISVGALLFAALAFQIALWWLLWRTSTPIVMGDEFRFAKDIFSDQTNGGSYSNFAFTALFEPWLREDGNWYSQIKLGNSIIWAVSALPLYAIFRSIGGRLSSVLSALFANILPIAIFAGTALPEVLFYLTAYSAIAFFVWSKDRPWMLALAGTFIGMGLMVKPHAGFLLVALVVATFAVGYVAKRTYKSSVIGAVFLLISALAVRFVGGLVLFGSSSLDLIGDYAATGLGMFEIPEQLQSLAQAGLVSAKSTLAAGPQFGPVLGAHLLHYLLAFAVIYLVPLIAVMAQISSSRSGSEENRSEGLRLWTALSSSVVVVALVALSFGVYVTMSGDDHSSRVLFRYVDYLYGPLFFGAALSNLRAPVKSTKWKLMLGAAAAASGISILVVNALQLRITPADSAMLSLFIENPFYWILSIAVLTVSALWRGRGPAWATVTALAAASALVATMFVANIGRFYNQDLAYLATDAELGIEELDESRVLFVATSNFFGTSAMMHSSSFDAALKVVAPFSQLYSRDLAPAYDSIVIIGGNETIFTDATIVNQSGAVRTFTSVPRSEPNVASIFTQSKQIGLLTDWGFWVNGDSLTIDTGDDMGAGKVIKLTVRKFPLWDGNAIEVTIGGETGRVTLSDALDDQVIEIELQESSTGIVKIKAEEPRLLRGPGFEGEQEMFSFGMVAVEVDGSQVHPSN